MGHLKMASLILDLRMCENRVPTGRSTYLLEEVEDDVPSLSKLVEAAKLAKTSLAKAIDKNNVSRAILEVKLVN